MVKIFMISAKLATLELSKEYYFEVKVMTP